MSVSDQAASGQKAIPAWVVVTALAMVSGLQPLTTDLYLPALPQMQREMSLSPSEAQWTLSVLMLAMGLGQLVWGPVADIIGRRPVLRWGLGLYVLSSLLTTVANDIGLMLVARALQGATLSAAVLCGRAMIRDLYPPEDGARMMAKGMTGLGIIALVGPVVGALTATWFGWRATMSTMVLFGSVALAFIWTHLPETLSPARRQTQLNWLTLVRNWWQIAQHPRFRAHTMLTASTYGGLFVYLAASAFVFIDILGTSRTAYGAGMSTLSLAYLVGTVVCRKLLPRRGLTGTIKLAGYCSLAGGLALLLVSVAQVTLHWRATPWSLLPGMWLYAFAHGIHQPCGQTGVVSAFPTQAGAASALSGFILSTTAFAVGALLSWWTALPGWSGTIHPMTLGMAFCGMLTAWVALGRVQRDGHVVGRAS